MDCVIHEMNSEEWECGEDCLAWMCVFGTNYMANTWTALQVPLTLPGNFAFSHDLFHAYTSFCILFKADRLIARFACFP
jgi:hypothetical protein